MKDNDISYICSANGIDKALFYREISMEEGNWGKNRLQVRDNIKMNIWTYSVTVMDCVKVT
jgi:hypothetical protein